MSSSGRRKEAIGVYLHIEEFGEMASGVALLAYIIIVSSVFVYYLGTHDPPKYVIVSKHHWVLAEAVACPTS